MTETPSGNRWEPADDDTAPVTPVSAAAPSPGVSPVRPHPAGRRTGVLAAGAAVLALAAGAGGYAVGSASAGSDGQDVGTTRQGPQDGFGPGDSLPGQGGRDDDHDQFGGSADSGTG